MSNPTNPEQVCPNDPSHKLSPGTLLCMTCGVPPVPVSKVAAKPKVRMGLDVESSNQLRPDPDKPQGLYASPYQPVKSPAPAPVDQPDELEQRLHKVFDDIYRYGGTGKAGARMVMGIYEPIIAREREASYAEGWRHGKFLEKNRHILHLRYMLDGYPSDAPEYTYVKSLFEREIAALTKGEETSQ